MAAQLPDVRLENVDEALRRRRRRRRSHARDPARQLLRHARAVRLRQDDDAAHDRRLRGAERRAHLSRRRATSIGLPPYRRDVNTVFQSYALFPHLTIVENVAFGLRRRGRRQGGRRKARVAEMLELVGLDRATSSGKPTAALRRPAAARRARPRARQPPARAAARRAARRTRPQAAQADAARAEARSSTTFGITFVHVTHDQEEAMTMADTIAVMNGGRIEQLGTPSELYERPRDGVRRRLPRRLEPALRHGLRPTTSVRLDGRRGCRMSSREALAGHTGASPSGSGRRRSGSARETASTCSRGRRHASSRTSASPRSSSSRRLRA